MAYFDCIVGGSSGDSSTLTVTCYSGFAGLTISITNGVDTFSEICPSSSPYEVVFDGLIDGTWTLSTIYDGATYTQTIEINTATQFFPVPNGATVIPTDDIQTWLNCAGIFDKNYTLLSQVLSDASTLQSLMASNNAVDYMVRSTTWANDVCADANAMTYIGANNYCANTLLANSTWRTTICNSQYFESVLTVKVPTMTSATTPSGTVLSSGNMANFPAYLAFDNNPSTEWISGSGSAVGAFAGYDFDANMTPYMFMFVSNSADTSYITALDIEGSNDNSVWTKIQSFSGLINGSNKKILSIISNYKMIRAKITAKTGPNGYARWFSLQFYGRE